jgi:hypothetical protein
VCCSDNIDNFLDAQKEKMRKQVDLSLLEKYFVKFGAFLMIRLLKRMK